MGEPSVDVGECCFRSAAAGVRRVAPVRKSIVGEMSRLVREAVVRQCSVALVVVFEMLTSLPSLAAGTAPKPLAVDDILQMEDFGRARLAPDGSYLIYEWIPPYESLGNFGALASTQDRRVLAKLRIVDLSRSTPARPLIEGNPGSGYWLGEISPTGERVAIYSLQSGTVQASVVDVRDGSETPLSFAPDCCGPGRGPIWSSESEIIYSGISNGEHSLVDHRTVLVGSLKELWQKAFTGRLPSATVLVSGDRDLSNHSTGRLLGARLPAGDVYDLTRGQYSNLLLSPDSRYLAAVRHGVTIQPRKGERLSESPPRRSKLAVFDLQEGTELPIPCVNCNTLPGSLAWSPSGDHLTFIAHEIDRSPRLSSLFQYRPKSGSLETVDLKNLELSCSTHWYRLNAPIPLSGDYLLLFGRRRDRAAKGILSSPFECNRGGRNDWFLVSPLGEVMSLTDTFQGGSPVFVGAAGTAIYVLAEGAIWRVSASGAKRRLTLGSCKGDMHLRVVASASSNLRAVLESRDALFLLNLKTESYVRIDKPTHDALLLDVAEKSDTAAFRINSASGSKLVVARSGHALRVIDEINTYLGDRVEARRKTLKYRAPDGSSLTSCLLLPPGADDKSRYPTIVYVYPNFGGGCVKSSLAEFEPLNFQLLAARGYGVLFAAAPRRLIRTAQGPTRGIVPVVLAAVEEAIRAGHADAERLGLFGFSQGFPEALQISAESQLFRAVVVGYGLSNFASSYGSMPLRGRLNGRSQPLPFASRFESEFSANWIGGAPWEDPESYVRNSPVFYADKLQAPILILHSDLDIFPLGQSEELFNALYRLGREAEYVTYWGEGHGNLSPANIRDFWQRVFFWYDTHLCTGVSPTERRGCGALAVK